MLCRKIIIIVFIIITSNTKLYFMNQYIELCALLNTYMIHCISNLLWHEELYVKWDLHYAA